MKRRTFLYQSSLAVGGSLALPQMLVACKKRKVNWDGRVGIIGGGAAGMMAANCLHQMGIDYSLFEAGPELGGRVKLLKDFGGAAIELGAEFVHGKRSDFYKICKAHGAEFLPTEDMESVLYWLDGHLVPEQTAANDANLQYMSEFIETIHKYDGPDITLQAHVDQNTANFPQRIHPILNAVLANAAGTSMSRLGLSTLAHEEDQWHSGNTDYLVPNKNFIDVLQAEFASALTAEKVRLEWPVASIDHGGDQVILTHEDGTIETVDKVIITVPLKVLQDGDITFTPALPTARTDAFDHIGMDAGMKILLRFNHAFWPEDFSGVIGGTVVPEFWTPQGATNVLTAFVMGEAAEALSSAGEDAVQQALAELDTFFGAGVASGALAESYIQDWTKEPFIKGAYSYPEVGTHGNREIIAAPIDDKLFFAGEATHTEGHNSTVHGAMETGERAAIEIRKSVVKA